MGRSLALALTAITAISAALLGVLLVSPPVPGPPPDAEEVRPGVPVVRSPNGNKPDLFTLRLRAGDLLRVTVEQQEADVVVSLLDAGGIDLLTIDFPTGSSGTETLVAVAETSGWHRLRIQALDSEEDGRYTLLVEEPHPAGPWERQLARAIQAFAEGEELLARQDGRALVHARNAYKDAADGLRSTGDERTLALVSDRRGDVAERLGELEEARDAYREAMQIQGRLGASDEVRLLNKLGPIERLLGESRAAEETLKLAQQKAEQSGDRSAEALAWNELGHLYKSDASLKKTLDAYHRALDIWKDLDDQDAETTALHNLGTFYSTLGRLPQARDLLGQALTLRRKAKDRKAEAATLTAIAWVEALEGRLPEALDLCDQAFELRKLEKDWRGAAVTLDRRGTVLRRAGRTDEALASYREALDFFAKSEERGLIAPTLANLGGLLVQTGDVAEGERLLMQALRLFRRSSDQESEAFVLLELSRAARRRGDLALALSRIEEAVRLVDSQRRATPGLELRASYAALRHGYSETQINLLMEAGFGLRALEASESSRGRALRESLEARSTGTNQEPEERVRALNSQLQALEMRRFGLQEADAPAEQVQGIERKITALLAKRDRLREAPPAPETSSEQPLLEEIRQLLGTDTLLLEYTLGEEKSFLWVLGADILETFELPRREVLEPLIQNARKQLSCSHHRTCRKPAEIAAADLGKILLGPVAHRLAAQRILIVPDGALHTIPFAALTLQRGGPPLLVDHEIVFAPSASLIARMRRERGQRPSPNKLLAMIGAPVYQGADGASSAPAETLRGSSPRGLLPLPQAEVEIREISKLVPPEQRLVALGYEANRQAVLDGLLEGATIVHFAAHAVLDPEQPELSSLVLSEVNPEGQQQDGSLRAYEIRDLDLSADLVVLSACSTGLGPEVRGEGPMGLARAFLDAGASRVVMSLWDVEDTATQELMRRFYQGMLMDGLPPASALRRAQLSMKEEKRWKAPYYWSGFVLQGDWQ